MTQQSLSLSWLRGKRFQRTVSASVTYALLTAIGLLMLVPLIWMVSTSLKPLGQIFVYPPQFIPRPPLWSNIPEALVYGRPLYAWESFLVNTLRVVVGVIVGSLISNSLAAFAFSRLRFPGREVLFMGFLATMMVPWAVVIIPSFLLFKLFGWIDTFKPLIVPSFLGNAFYIFMLRQFFNTIPAELDEAARIDGASSLQIYAQIILPLAKPALATMTIFLFLGTWNSFFWPLIILTDPRKWTLALAFSGYGQTMTATAIPWNYIMVMATFLVLPCLVVFFFAQKTFIQGITLTGLKG